LLQDTNNKEELTLRVYENRVLRIFGPKREEIVGGWKMKHVEEFHNLYASPNIIRVIRSRTMRWTVHVARLEVMRNAYSILVGKPEGKRPLGRPRHRWEDKIRMELGKKCGRLWTGFITLTIGTSGGLL
jgi:hypothetical protein